jgi:hypothetical protein
MASNPIGVLMTIGIYVATYGLVAADLGATKPDTMGLDKPPEIKEVEDNWWDVLASIINSVWGVVTMLVGALTFNVPGAPLWIRLPIAVTIVGSLTWSIATLVRGN